jgi:uncharacterized protein (TIGR02246 family)
MTLEGARGDAESAARNIVTALERAWNAHDAAAWAAVFRADARFTNVFGIEIRSSAEILRTHAHIMTTMFRDSHTRFDPPSVFVIRQDVACVSARWRMSGGYDAEGRPWDAREGVMHLVIVPDEGGWKIAAGNNMDLPPQTRRSEMQSVLQKAGGNGASQRPGGAEP